MLPQENIKKALSNDSVQDKNAEEVSNIISEESQGGLTPREALVIALKELSNEELDIFCQEMERCLLEIKQTQKSQLLNTLEESAANAMASEQKPNQKQA